MGARFAWSNQIRSSIAAGLALLPGLLFVAIAALAACAGSTATPAKAPHESAAGAASDAPSGDSAGEREAPQPTLCQDGTCSACGTGICPSGWYCDESAMGGPACGWLPQCAQKSSCGCLTNLLGSNCACSERASGLHVACK